MTNEVGTLKELKVKPGDILQCEDDGDHEWWTIGKFYEVKECGTPEDDDESTYENYEDPQPGVKFRIISRAYVGPKMWGEMTSEEKGALLLAAHEGKKIEFFVPGACGVKWLPARPKWTATLAYRVRPERKRETVTLTGADFGKGKSVSWSFRQKGHIGPETHRVTFDLVDGEPDCDSVKMEKL